MMLAGDRLLACEWCQAAGEVGGYVDGPGEMSTVLADLAEQGRGYIDD